MYQAGPRAGQSHPPAQRCLAELEPSGLTGDVEILRSQELTQEARGASEDSVFNLEAKITKYSYLCPYKVSGPFLP